jgi:hypothetical protein
LNLVKPFYGVEYDPKSNFYLEGIGFAGDKLNELVLWLHPGPKKVTKENAYYINHRSIKSLPHLRTGRGVNIGDTLQQVRRKLGAQPKHEGYDPNLKTKVWLTQYERQVWVTVPAHGGKREKWIYRALYWFESGRLSSIRYSLSNPIAEKY